MIQPSAEVSTGSRFDAGRLTSLSDGIFAVALTLLILDIKPPETDPAHLARTLATTIPPFGIFALSFAIVSYHWVVHQLIFGLLKAVDRRLIWLNLAFLFTIVVLPFSAAVLGRYPLAPPALVLYGTNMAACSAALMLVWWYMLRAKLTTKLLPSLQHYISIRFIIWFALSIVGIGFASFLPIGSLAIFVALPVLYTFSSRSPK
jgi:uncharacterized membrane protein